MDKIFKVHELTELIGVYAATIARVTLTACSAYALLREMTDTEAGKIVDDIETASDAFVSAYREKMALKGIAIDKAQADRMRNELNEQILIECWTLMQKVAEEMKQQATTAADGKTFDISH